MSLPGWCDISNLLTNPSVSRTCQYAVARNEFHLADRVISLACVPPSFTRLHRQYLHRITHRNFNITGSDLYDLFGKYGAIRQIRLGTDTNLKTKGTAYVVYESPDDAKDAITHLNGFHLMERYIVGESTPSNFCTGSSPCWHAELYDS